MKVHQIEVGDMANFTYILEDEETNDAPRNRDGWKLPVFRLQRTD